MEVEAQVEDFHFNSTTTTPYMSTPSSPKNFGSDLFEIYYHYTRAPISPKRFASSPPPNSVGYAASAAVASDDADFAFDFNGHVDKCAPPPELVAADELFYEGKIRPLKFPLGFCPPAAGQNIVAKYSDPFSSSMAEATRDGRGRNRPPSLSSRSRKGSRSLSPLRGESDCFSTPLKGSITYPCKEEGDSSSSKKWSFKNLLLFRSASEGRATGDRNKDRLRKYTAACSSAKLKKGCGGDELNGSSFRSSPHAIHYAANRAASEEMKRKTALPYKESFFNWLRFSPSLRSFNSLGVGDNSSNRGKSIAGPKSLPRLR